jgi:alkanesulfonate monooxygenase SsuD/methylene tetrahydromethanopterin reductase-like flavin-dependent oxidoreductase (luciferase family)
MMLARRTGRFEPLRSPDESLAHPSMDEARALPSNRIVGTPADAIERLDELASLTHAAEVMVSTVTYDLPERLQSLELLAHAWFS